MTVDTLRPSGTNPLELFRSQFRQAQGANDSASIPLVPLSSPPVSALSPHADYSHNIPAAFSPEKPAAGAERVELLGEEQ